MKKKTEEQELEELEAKIEAKRQKEFEKKELPSLKKQYLGKYFKYPVSRGIEEYLYVQVVDVVATAEEPYKLLLRYFSSDGESSFSFSLKDEVPHTSTASFVNCLKPSTKEEFDTNLNRTLHAMFGVLGIEHNLSKMAELAIFKKKVKTLETEVERLKEKNETGNKVLGQKLKLLLNYNHFVFWIKDFVKTQPLFTSKRLQKEINEMAKDFK